MSRPTLRGRAWVPALVAALALLLTSCTGSDAPSGGASPSFVPSPAAPPTATPVGRPGTRVCHDLTYTQALAPTVAVAPVDCERRHTSMTFAVDTLDTVVDGHLLAVDSTRVQQQVATTCPQRLERFLGGSEEARRLSMLRSVWFTPTVEESDAGADWLRCDVIAVAGDEALAPLTGRLQGVLDRPEGRERYALCGTAEPGSADFERVVCTAQHSWRAVATVDVPGERYPGEDAAREAGQTPCEDAGREAADDPLNFQWGYEWPTLQQWRDGQRYGVCWAPD